MDIYTYFQKQKQTGLEGMYTEKEIEEYFFDDDDIPIDFSKCRKKIIQAPVEDDSDDSDNETIF